MEGIELRSCAFHDADESSAVPYVKLDVGFSCGAVVPYVITTTGEHYEFNFYSGIGFPGEAGAGLLELSEEDRRRLVGDDPSAGCDQLLKKIREALCEEIQQAEDRIANLWFERRIPVGEC